MDRLLLPSVQSKPRAVVSQVVLDRSVLVLVGAVGRTDLPPPRSGVSRPCTPYGRDRGTFPNVAGPARPPTCHAREAGAAAIGHADRPDQVERKTTEYPSRARGVKAGPGWPGPVRTKSAARPHAWQEATPARRSPPPARRCPCCPPLYYRTQAGLLGSGWRRALFTCASTRPAWATFPPAFARISDSPAWLHAIMHA